MTTLHIALTSGHAVFADHAADVRYTVPVGTATLAAMIAADPPLPEELTNAIGIFMDHIEDVTREVPSSTFAEVIEVRGPGLQALVDTEAGHAKGLPFSLSRDAAEELFRTLATETAADRACNPGLPPDEVHHVLGVCCAVVAMLRALHASELVVIADAVAQ